MATLRQYYDMDFTHVVNTSSECTFRNSKVEFPVTVRVHKDFDSNTKYISCFIPACTDPLDVCNTLLKQVDDLLAIADNVSVQTSLPGEQAMDSKDLRFSGRVFFYSETDISVAKLESLQAQASLTSISTHFRGPVFAEKRAELECPLAFISHDSRDKAEIARPIAAQLQRLMCPVWYDEFSLMVGDSLRESIEKGIKECKNCIVVLTPNFLSNLGWTKNEFDAIFTRQILQKTNLILPVWCGVSAADVFEYSPSLADKVGLQWSLGVEEVSRQLYRAITTKPQLGS